MALERINQDFRILSNYSLEVIIEDTQCKTALILNAFIEFMSRSHSKSIVGILGPACSVQTEIIAEVAPFYNTIIMGYSVEGVALADREKYPLFFRTSPSYAEFKYAYATIFEFFEWKQYASLTDTNYVSSTVTATHQYLAGQGISLVYARQITNQDSVDIKTYLRSLLESSAKIVIATLFEGLARAVVCEAYHQVRSFLMPGSNIKSQHVLMSVPTLQECMRVLWGVSLTSHLLLCSNVVGPGKRQKTRHEICTS